MERGLIMLLHSLIIGVLVYIFLFFIIKNKQTVAENRAIFIGSFILSYMLLFGHGLPISINKELI